MKINFGHEATTSFSLWFDDFLIKTRQASYIMSKMIGCQRGSIGIAVLINNGVRKAVWAELMCL